MEAGFFARRVFRRELEKIKFQLKSLKVAKKQNLVILKIKVL